MLSERVTFAKPVTTAEDTFEYSAFVRLSPFRSLISSIAACTVHVWEAVTSTLRATPYRSEPNPHAMSAAFTRIPVEIACFWIVTLVDVALPRISWVQKVAITGPLGADAHWAEKSPVRPHVVFVRPLSREYHVAARLPPLATSSEKKGTAVP